MMPVKKRPYNPTNDLLFKNVFGSEKHKNVTVQFINDVLGRVGEQAIVDIEFRDTDLNPQKDTDKLGRLDICGILSDQSRIDIELQVANHRNMGERTVFYWAQMYLHFESLKVGQDYLNMKPAIVIAVICYNFLPQDEPHAEYGIYNPATGHRLTDLLELHFLEVPKFKRKPIKEMNAVERWLAYFANKLNQEERRELSMSNPAIGEAIAASEAYMMDDAAYMQYIRRESAIWDYNTDVKASRAEGIDIGMKRGLERGMKRGMKRGLERGVERGLERGLERGAERVNKLIQYLIRDGKTEQIAKMTTDGKLQADLMKQYNID